MYGESVWVFWILFLAGTPSQRTEYVQYTDLWPRFASADSRQTFCTSAKIPAASLSAARSTRCEWTINLSKWAKLSRSLSFTDSCLSIHESRRVSNRKATNFPTSPRNVGPYPVAYNLPQHVQHQNCFHIECKWNCAIMMFYLSSWINTYRLLLNFDWK